MSNVVFKLNSAGVVELLRSDGMQAVLKDYADQVQSRCTAGNVSPDEYKVSVYMSGDRAKAKVTAATPHARNSNRVHETLSKALWG